MSLYVKYLLKHSKEIRELVLNPLIGEFTVLTNKFEDEDIEDLADYLVSGDESSISNNDLFDDLILVEKKIEELRKLGYITSRDMDLIETMGCNPTMFSMRRLFGKERAYVTTRFNVICKLVSDSLGDIFTDEGYMLYMKDKYKLTDDQVNTGLRLMKKLY